MKTTYLVNQEQPDGSICLTVVSSGEWLSVVEMNKQLPLDQRRYFIIDYIDDGDELDRMVIEAPRSDYLAWLKEHNAAERNRSLGSKYQHLSLDVLVSENERSIRLGDMIPSDEVIEESVINQMMQDNLREMLSAWKPWASDLLEIYLHGDKRTCTNTLAEKYGVSPQVIRKYKRQFENFIKNFSSGVSF